MNLQELTSTIDHTILKPIVTENEVFTICEEAMKYKTASACIPPSYVKRMKEHFLDSLTICTVIGFPLGYNSTSAKISEAQIAISEGADEIDMVVNVSAIKSGNFSYVKNEIQQIREVTTDKILKVIIETCYLTNEEKIELCHIISDTKADYIKTSTGFGPNGAAIEDIKLFRQHLSKQVKIKAAGGIRNYKAMKSFIEAGCDRIGTSSLKSILSEVTAL